MATVAIVGISAIFGWFYSKSIGSLVIGSPHFIVTLVTFVIVGTWAHWFSSDWKIVLTGISSFIFIFLIIWISHYTYWRNKINKLNSKFN